jgi:hypothetical protein
VNSSSTIHHCHAAAGQSVGGGGKTLECRVVSLWYERRKDGR